MRGEDAMNVENAVRAVKVFVSSPVDVAPERGRVQAVATKLNREYQGLVRFDTVPGIELGSSAVCVF